MLFAASSSFALTQKQVVAKRATTFAVGFFTADASKLCSVMSPADKRSLVQVGGCVPFFEDALKAISPAERAERKKALKGFKLKPQQIKIKGKTATITAPLLKKHLPKFRFLKVNGKWFVDLAAIANG